MHLNQDAKQLRELLLAGPGRRAPIADIPRLTNWDADRAVEALSELQQGEWLVIEGDPPFAKLKPWVVVWCKTRVRKSRLLGHPDRITAQNDAMPGDDPEFPPVTFGVPAKPWREVHPKDCRAGCRACSRKLSGTRPPPKGDCAVCGGKPLPKGWICGGCHRKG